jgi:hypothetical protein
LSIEGKLNRVSEFAALLYTWCVPHARDDCRLPKRDPEELRLLIFPGRQNRTSADMASAFAELVLERLMGIDEEGYYFFPSEIFYKYQSYVGKQNRRETPKLNEINTSGNQRESAENSASPSPSPSHSPSSSIGCAGAPPLRARAELVIDNDLGLEKHPAKICGWDMWNRLERFWKGEGKRLTIFQVEMIYKFLSDAQDKGHDPTKIVEKAVRSGWMDLYEPDKEPVATPLIMNRAEIRQRAIENAKRAKAKAQP